ncbi:hypothetical protein L211DRAFT_668739 [Terfezia boudieri ATCC MYA-4762]|uniref:Uncharacterized protein n=1 Tax=Terfezia boudieri ATCC MYA-4762 TaxID=1051890 RepID=A0A3N4L8W3_9PEZI|nr:hypothetical protein L211DRAFT_668739 [Terfezia boudieri ATCC MYA-4762]
MATHPHYDGDTSLTSPHQHPSLPSVMTPQHQYPSPPSESVMTKTRSPRPTATTQTVSLTGYTDTAMKGTGGILNGRIRRNFSTIGITLRTHTRVNLPARPGHETSRHLPVFVSRAAKLYVATNEKFSQPPKILAATEKFSQKVWPTPRPKVHHRQRRHRQGRPVQPGIDLNSKATTQPIAAPRTQGTTIASPP